MISDKHIGDLISSRRRALGMSANKFATDLSISVDQLEALESGSQTVTAEQLYTVCHILNVSPSWFFDGIDPASKSSDK